MRRLGLFFLLTRLNCVTYLLAKFVVEKRRGRDFMADTIIHDSASRFRCAGRHVCRKTRDKVDRHPLAVLAVIVRMLTLYAKIETGVQ